MSMKQKPDSGSENRHDESLDEAEEQESLRSSELCYRKLFQSTQDGILILDAETGMVVEVNPFLVSLLGYPRETFLFKKVWELGFLEEAIANEDKFRELQARDYVLYEDLPMETSDGRQISVEVVSNVYLVNELRVIQCNIRDITQRKRNESLMSLQAEVLKVLATDISLAQATEKIVEVIKHWTGHDAVGLRISKDSDYPFVSSLGYSEDFLKAENSLLKRYSDGGLCRNPDGTISLECTCGMIISGKTDPENPFFTAGGSAWTNNSLTLLDVPPAADLRLNPRNRCIHAGFLSLALIPVRAGNKILGLLHLADRRQNQFTPSTILFYEGIGASIGVALVRKQAEEQIRFQAEIIENSPVITAYHDKDLNLVWANRAYQKATGLTLNEVSGRKCYKVWNLSKPCHGCPVITAIETGENAASELTPANQDNWPETQGSWLSQAVPLRDKQGTVIGALEFAIDITERKQAEAYREMGLEILQILNEPGDLRQSIQRIIAVLKARTGVDAVGLRLQEGEDFPYFAQDGFSNDFLLAENTLLERYKDGGVCRGKDGNVNLECTCGLVISGKTDPANPLFTQGGSCWTNDSFPLLDLPSDQEPRLHPRNNCIHEGYASVALIPIRTRDRIVGLIQLNDKRKGLFSLQSIEILEGIAAHIGSALMRKHAEDEREKIQAQLTQAQKMESVGRLAGGVAHDFNNMLGVILGHTEMALDQIDKDHQLFEGLLEIQKAAQRSAELTARLLAFARKQTISPRVIDLNQAVEGMLNMLRRLIGEDIDLIWRPLSDLWPVRVDPAQIDQVLANFTVNARDAIEGVGKVTIETCNTVFDRAYCEDHAGYVPGEYVMIAVSDNGCGMDSETLSHIFEPFYSTKKVGKGTGLGLAMVYGVVKQNNGFVNVYSEPGHGSTFKVYLPRHMVDDVLETKEFPQPSTLPGNEIILLVEDEPAILKMTTRMLEREGYTVVTAGTPGEAIRLANEHAGDIHILITDVVMPEMNGRDLAKKILSVYPGLHCLFMSGYTANVIAHHGILDEGVDFIQKPFSKRDLTVKVREILDRDLEN